MRRRNFLKNTTLTSLAILFSSRLTFANGLNIVESEINIKSAKRYFYNKQYSQSREILFSLLETNPNEIKIYDWLAKSFRAEQDLLSASAVYYKGLENNQDNVDFYNRFAVSIRRLSHGNNKQAVAFRMKYGSFNLEQEIEKLLIEAAQVSPESKEVQINSFNQNRLKYTFKKNNNSRDRRYRNDVPMGSYLLLLSSTFLQSKEERKLTEFTIEELKNKILSIDSKNRRSINDESTLESRINKIAKEKIKVYRELVRKYGELRNREEVLNYSKKIFALSPNDTETAKRIRIELLNQGRYSEAIEFQESFLEFKPNNVWRQIGLLKCIKLAVESNTIDYRSVNDKLYTVLDDLESKNTNLSSIWYVSYIQYLAWSYQQEGKYQEAGNIYLDALLEISNVSRDLTDTMLVEYAKNKISQGQYLQAKTILQYITSAGITLNSDLSIIRTIQDNKLKVRIYQGSSTNLKPYYTLYQILKEHQEYDEANIVLDQIKSINPDDSFAKKYMS